MKYKANTVPKNTGIPGFCKNTVPYRTGIKFLIPLGPGPGGSGLLYNYNIQALLQCVHNRTGSRRVFGGCAGSASNREWSLAAKAKAQKNS